MLNPYKDKLLPLHEPKKSARAPHAVDNLRCPECGALMHFCRSKFGPFYGCTRYPECKATHGAHPDGRPLGLPADKPTKDARIRVHGLLAMIWNWDIKSERSKMYAWLARNSSVKHVASMDLDECIRIEEILRKMIK